MGYGYGQRRILKRTGTRFEDSLTKNTEGTEKDFFTISTMYVAYVFISCLNEWVKISSVTSAELREAGAR